MTKTRPHLPQAQAVFICRKEVIIIVRGNTIDSELDV